MLVLEGTLEIPFNATIVLKEIEAQRGCNLPKVISTSSSQASTMGY